MPSGWEVYYVVFLSAILALGIPVALVFISGLISSNRKAPKKLSQMSEKLQIQGLDEAVLGRRINTRFFLGANAALVLITLALALIPCAGILQHGIGKAGLIKALISIVTIGGFSALGLLYSARKGDLNWLESFREEEK